MKVRALIRSLLAMLAPIAIALPRPVSACAACFGRSDSPMAQGMNMGILSLLLVVVAVLGGIAAFFVFLIVRAARHGAGPPVTPAEPAAHLSQPASQPTP